MCFSSVSIPRGVGYLNSLLTKVNESLVCWVFGTPRSLGRIGIGDMYISPAFSRMKFTHIKSLNQLRSVFLWVTAPSRLGSSKEFKWIFLDKRWMFPDSTPTDPIVIFSGRGDSFRDLRAPWDIIPKNRPHDFDIDRCGLWSSPGACLSSRPTS